MIHRTRATGGLMAAVGAALLLAGCATAGSAGSATTAAATSSASPSVTSPMTTTTTSAANSAPVSSTSSTVPDWPTIQAEVAEADGQLATAESEGWWSGPVCNPDVGLHRENAGQDPLSDEQLRAECAANLAEFWASRDDYAALQALDAAARTAELARVGMLLGMPAGQEPTVGQVVVVHGCEQGWITDPTDCAGIPSG